MRRRGEVQRRTKVRDVGTITADPTENSKLDDEDTDLFRRTKRELTPMERLDELFRFKDVKAKPNAEEQATYQIVWRRLAERDGMNTHTIDYLIRGNVFLAGVAFMEYCAERPDGDEILQEVCEDITRTQDHLKRRQVFNTLLTCMVTALRYVNRPDRVGYLASMIVKVATNTRETRHGAVTGGLERSLRSNLLSQISPGTEFPDPEDMRMTRHYAEEFLEIMQILIKRLEHVRLPQRQELAMFKVGAWINEIESWAANAGSSGEEHDTGIKTAESACTDGSEQELRNARRMRNLNVLSNGSDTAEGKSLIVEPPQNGQPADTGGSGELGWSESDR